MVQIQLRYLGVPLDEKPLGEAAPQLVHADPRTTSPGNIPQLLLSID